MATDLDRVASCKNRLWHHELEALIRVGQSIGEIRAFYFERGFLVMFD